jgi:hypothetical protein
MSNTTGWLIALVLALAVVGMIVYARGAEHHRGDEVGTHGTKIIVVQPSQ